MQNEIKQLKLEKDTLIKDVYEKYSIINALTNTAASIEEIGSQTEYRKLKYIRNKINKPLNTRNKINKDFEYQIRQYQNQRQIRSNLNKNQHYRSNVIINHYQENDNLQSQHKD